jgi:hypothetical protein
MISLCAVELEGLQIFTDLLIKSAAKNTKLISEILIAKIGVGLEPNTISYYVDKIKVTKFNFPLTQRTQQGVEHALGLHACIDRSQTEYIFLSDPDIIYYSPVESLYLDLMNKHDLNIIGASHHSAAIMAYTFFPWIGNCLIKKANLPEQDFLKGYLKDGPIPMDGKFLIPNKIDEFVNDFPNPKGHFDTGSNMTIWNKCKNGKWLSFQTIDCHHYTTTYCRGNVKLNYKLPKMKLFYHLVGVSNNRPEFLEQFTKAFEND